MTGRLVHTGQVVLDLVMRVPSLPPTGGDVLAESTELLAGGGFNVMAAAARSGAEVVYAGAHGTGRFADQAREALRAERIEAVQPQRTDSDNGICVVLVEPGGERTFVTGVGAEGRLLPEQLSQVRTEPEESSTSAATACCTHRTGRRCWRGCPGCRRGCCWIRARWSPTSPPRCSTRCCRGSTCSAATPRRPAR